MRIGVVFPQTEIGPDPGVVREYAQAAEDLGYTHLLVYDHVIGADLTKRPDWSGPYSLDDQFHEPFVLFGYLAGFTRTLQFVTGILILPQRQTVLVAKQAAEVDVLSRGRLRLGVGIGWNPIEFEALGESFHNRGRRSEEQIALLRRLLTESSVTFHGQWHRVEAAGINPLPVQRPVPIWIGGDSDATLERVARMGDGWFPQVRPDARAREMLDRLFADARRIGRDPSTIGIEARVSIARKTPDEWRDEVVRWKELGATHLAVNTMRAGITTPAGHIDAIRRFKDAIVGVGSAAMSHTGSESSGRQARY